MLKWIPWKNKFGIEGMCQADCGAGGHCQFLALSAGLRPVYNYSAAQLRGLAGAEALKLSDDQFRGIIDVYREELKDGEFAGTWDPRQCKTKADLQRAIVTPNVTGDGNAYQGDAVTVDLLSRALRVNVVVFYHRQGYSYEYGASSFRYTTCLLYHSGGNFHHYQLLGILEQARTSSNRVSSALPPQVRTLFDVTNLPKCLQLYLDSKKRRCDHVDAAKTTKHVAQQVASGNAPAVFAGSSNPVRQTPQQTVAQSTPNNNRERGQTQDDQDQDAERSRRRCRCHCHDCQRRRELKHKKRHQEQEQEARRNQGIATVVTAATSSVNRRPTPSVHSSPTSVSVQSSSYYAPIPAAKSSPIRNTNGPRIITPFTPMDLTREWLSGKTWHML